MVVFVLCSLEGERNKVSFEYVFLGYEDEALVLLEQGVIRSLYLEVPDTRRE